MFADEIQQRTGGYLFGAYRFHHAKGNIAIIDRYRHMLYRPQPENAPYGIANRNTKLRGHASVAWLFGAAQDSKLQRTPPRSPLVAEIHRHADSLIHFGRSEERRVGKERVSPCRSRWSPYH